jgi:hypothetical protein
VLLFLLFKARFVLSLFPLPDLFLPLPLLLSMKRNSWMGRDGFGIRLMDPGVCLGQWFNLILKIWKQKPKKKEMKRK